PPGTAGTGGTAAYTADRALPRLELLGRPRLNRRSGRLTLSFSLPGPGTAEAAAVALHRCRSVKGKRSAACPEPALGYRHAKRKAELAGTYTLTLVPDPAARVELEHGAVLTERVTLVLR